MKILSIKKSIFKYFALLSFLLSFINTINIHFELKSGEFFNKTSLANQEFFYIIKTFGISNIKKIFIDIMTYVGDTKIITYFYNINNITVEQYTSKNKNSLIITILGDSEKLNDMTFSVKSNSNSFYTVLSKFAYTDTDDSLMTNEMKIGHSYLITLDPKTNDKILSFKNERIIEKKPIMLIFNSLNCIISLEQLYKYKSDTLIYLETKKFEQISYDIIDPNNEEYYGRYSENLEYKIDILESNFSENDGNLCMIYVSAIEGSLNHEETINDILIANNIPQQVVFGHNFNHVSYGFVHIDYKNDLIIKFTLKHKAQYKIILYYEYEKRGTEETITSNDILYLKSEEWNNKCIWDKGCYIQLDITLEKIEDSDNPVLEFSIEMIGTN